MRYKDFIRKVAPLNTTISFRVVARPKRTRNKSGFRVGEQVVDTDGYTCFVERITNVRPFGSPATEPAVYGQWHSPQGFNTGAYSVTCTQVRHQDVV